MLNRTAHRAQAAAFEAAHLPGPVTQPARGARPVETNGWDVVSAVRIADINEAIENAATSPEHFAQTMEGGVTVRGRFAPWRIGPDGDGKLINLDIGLQDVEIEIDGVPTTLAAALAIVRVYLDLMPTGRKGLLGATPSRELALVIKTELDAGLLTADPEAKVARVLETEGAEHLDPLARVYLNIGLEAWLNAHIQQFHHVFATVNLMELAADEAEGQAFDWMMPSAVGYAFARNAVAPENSALAVLCQTGGRDAAGLVLQSQADLIPESANGAFVISKRRLVRDMILPGAAGGFKGLKTSDFRLRKADGGLSLKDPVKLHAIEDDAGDRYDPMLDKLDIVVRDTEIAIESRTKTEIRKGVRSVCTSVARYGFGLTTNTEGEKTLGYTTLEAPDPVHGTEHDRATEIMDWVWRIIGFIAIIVAGVATGGAAWIAAAVMIACLVGEVNNHLVERAKRNDSPPIDLLVAQATTAVRWSTGTRFEPTFAALNGGLQVGGLLSAPKSQSLIDSHRAFQAPYQPVMAAREAA